MGVEIVVVSWKVDTRQGRRCAQLIYGDSFEGSLLDAMCDGVEMRLMLNGMRWYLIGRRYRDGLNNFQASES